MFCDKKKKAEEDLELLSEVYIAAELINKTGQSSSPLTREHPTMAQFNSSPEQGDNIQTVCWERNFICTNNQT